jgi:hypothetical protein
MFKKISILILSLFIMTSCGSEESVVETSWLEKYQGEWYSVSIPSNWEIMNDKNNILPEPSNGKIELSAQAPEPKGWFINNILVLSDDLKTFTDSSEYSMANNVWARREYTDYLQLENKDFSFIDGTNSKLYVFEAKYNLETPKLKFLQTAYVCNPNKGYFLTIAISPSIKVIDKYETLLSTFSCALDENLTDI